MYNPLIHSNSKQNLLSKLTALLLLVLAGYTPLFAQSAQSAPLDTLEIQPAMAITHDSIGKKQRSAAEIPAAQSHAEQPAAELPAVKVNPVDIDREKPEQPAWHYYDKHGNALETPVRFLSELDTITKIKSKPIYKAFNGVSIGANFFDAILMLVGQRRANFDLWVDCSIHNWFFPVVEAGIGFSNAKPNDGRFHFKVAPSFYAKVGMNYNFLYKSNPDYQVYLGLRAGFSSFNYDILSISPGSDYYTESGPTDVTDLHSTAIFGEALAGLKVKIYKFFSMGWGIRYGFRFKQTYSNADYTAWFTPGYGASTPISATFSLIFTIR